MLLFLECPLTDEFKLQGVKMTSREDAASRYYVNDIYTYECIFGYKKVVEDVIQCGADGNWTASPSCAQRGKCTE